jgi:hypothetical protein
MSKDTSFVQSSLKDLTDLTRSTYNNQIQSAALQMWQGHLQPENPQWQHIDAHPLVVDGPKGSAHAIAMMDLRLPKFGLVGYFAATTPESGAEVLSKAGEFLKTRYNVKDVYGPIHGTITRDYRINLSDDLVIPGEPINPSWHIDSFTKAGYEIFNRYVSGRADHYRLFVNAFVRQPSKANRQGLHLRPFDVNDQIGDLKIYHDLMNAIFIHNSIYCPVLSWEERLYNMATKDPIFDPVYTYFLEADGKPVGFIVAFPFEDNLIVKTIGVLPEYRGKYYSGLLIHKIHKQAASDHLKSAYYSTVRVGNSVYRMRRPGVSVFRRYVTMHLGL